MAEYNESQINTNETERISAEQQRIQNEAKRQTAETEREAREVTRQSNESTRISEYNTFMADAQSEYNSFITNAENAEDERIANEQSRVQAEASRVNAENNRGIRLGELENEVAPLVSDLSSSISEELINENVTSFKVGTSNVTNVDLSNQMEQSLVDVTYIKGKTVKENSKVDSVKVVFDSGEKELYSLQGEFFDEYKNGKLHKMIKKITPKDFEVIHMHSGLEHNWNNSSGTYAFYFNYAGGDCIDESALMCNILDAISYSDLTDGTRTGIFLSKEWSWIGIRVDDNIIGVSNSDNESQKFEKAKTWFFNSNIEIHYLVNETITDESITIFANPNEEINVVSGTPTTIKHIVQLNTKSQVEETQKQIMKSNKSIWQKLKELIDVEFNIGQNGYIKLPTILGGLLIQWGRTSIEFTNEQYKAIIVKYPIPFKEDIYFQTCNMFNACTEAYETNTSIVWDSISQGKICIYNTRGTMSCDVFVYYISLGK